MQHQIQALLNDLKTLVLSHPAVHQVHLRGEEVTANRGYLRMRLALQSQDIVEIFVYLSDEHGVVRLRLQPSLATSRRHLGAEVGYRSASP